MSERNPDSGPLTDVTAVQVLLTALAVYAAEGNWEDTTLGPEVNTAGYVTFTFNDGRTELPWSVAQEAIGRVARRARG